MSSISGTSQRDDSSCGLRPDGSDRKLEPICRQFEDYWRAGQSPSLRAFLREAAKLPPPARFEHVAMELIRIDLEYRWSVNDGSVAARGSARLAKSLGDGVLPLRPRVDDYVKVFPELGDAADVPIELIRLEYCLRSQQGERPPAEEYFERYKQRSDILEILDLVDRSQGSTRAPASRGDARVRQIRLSCPHCRESVSADGDQSRAVMCGHCGHTIRLISGTTVPALDSDRFEIIERLGVGGFGTVWKARDKKLDRVVALKLPRRGQFEGDEVEKFLREAQAAAQLNHDNIVAVYDFDFAGDDCFIVSELVEGVALSKWLEDHELAYMQAAKLCRTVAIALDYAHRRGIVHRDLKPSNIIVDKQLVPHITDFGLAKRDVAEVTMTLDGQLLGTPAYMSPEQANGHGHDVDGRADIYALGVVMYRLLTGELPFRGNVHMMLNHVIHDDPVSPRQLNHRIPRDLETICLKCLEKQPSRRFATAEELADELARFQSGEPIKSRPRSAPMRLWRWAMRNRMAALVGVLLMIVISAGPAFLVHVSNLTEQQNQARYNSMVERIRSVVANQESGYRQTTNRLLGEALALDAGDRNLDELRNIIVQSMGDFFGFEPKSIQLDGIATSVAIDEAETRIAVGLADGRIAILDTDGRRLATYNALGGDDNPVRALRFEEPVAGELATVISVNQSGRVVRQSQSAKAEVLEQLDLNPIRTAQFDARGKWLVAHDDRSVEVWDVETWTLEFHDRPEVSESLTTACMSSDCRYLVAGYSTENPEQCGFVRWDLQTGEMLQKENVDHSVTTPNGACFSHDGRYLAFGCTKLLFYDAMTLQPAFSPISFDVQAVATSSDGRYLASYNYQGEIEIRDASTFQPLAVCSSPANMSSQGAFDLYFAPGGGRLIASHANSLRVWDLNAAPERKRLIGHQEKIGTVTFSHGGTWVASASHDGTVRVWNAENGIPVRPPLNVGSRVHCVAFSSGDRYLAAATWDEPMIYVWSTGDWQIVGTLKHDLGDVTALCFHAERNQLVASGADGLAIWNLVESGDQVELHLVDLEPERRALHVVTNRHSENIAWVGGNEKSVRIRDWQAGTSRKLGGGAAIMLDAWHGLALYPDGERLIFLGANGKLEIWDVRANRIQKTVDKCGEFHLPLVACSPDGRWLLTKTDRRSVVIWNTESWEQSIVLPAERAGVDTVAWHPKSNQIAMGTSDGLISLWNLSMIRDELKTLRLVSE